MRLAVLVSILALAPACKDGEKSTAGKVADGVRTMTKDRKPTGTPRPQDKLVVTLDGKPVPMVAALAWKSWDGRTRIEVSSMPVGCDEVTGDMRFNHDGEVNFHIDVSRALQPDGTFKPMLATSYFSGMNQGSIDKVITSTGDGSPGQPMTAEVDFESESAGSVTKKLTVKGTIDAIGCTAEARKDVPPLPAPMPGTIEIAGKKLPIRFAKLDISRDWPSLELYTGGEACKQVAFSPTSELKVDLTWFDKAKPEVSQITIGGSILPGAIDQTFDKAKLTVTPMPLAAGELELAGDITINGYPVKLAGKVTAVVCPKD